MKEEMVTVSAKIPKRLKVGIEKGGVKMSEAIRKGLEKELRETKLKQLEKELSRIDLSRVSVERMVGDIRRAREERRAHA